MSLWDDITEKVGAGSRVVADKAKEVSEIANIRAQIVGCDNTLVKNYKELGKAYYEAHKDDAEQEFAEIMAIIRDANDKKAVLNNQLTERKSSSKGAASDLADTVDEVSEDIADKVSDVADTVKDVVEDITE